MGQGRQSGDVTRECALLLSLFFLGWCSDPGQVSRGTREPARLKTGKGN